MTRFLLPGALIAADVTSPLDVLRGQLEPRSTGLTASRSGPLTAALPAERRSEP